jgi:hypothetical protein
LFSAYQKATTKIVVANFILPLIWQTVDMPFYYYFFAISFSTAAILSASGG